MTLGLIIDIILAALLVLSIIVGAIRGLFKSVIAVVITIASIIGAVILSGIFVDKATDIVYPRVQEKMEQMVTEPTLHINIGAILSNATDKKIEEFINYELTDDYFESGIAEDVVKIAEKFGLSEKDVRKPLESGLKKAQELLKNYVASDKASEQENATTVVDNAVEVAAKDFLRPIVRAGLGIILFILLSIVLKLIMAVIDNAMKKTTGVKQVNALGGAVLSFVETAVIIYILLYICHKYGFTNMYQEQISGSYVLQFLLRYMPS